MRFLRTAPTRRLLATIAGVVIAAVSGTAIAVAATSGGPVPAPKPLAQAIHDSLAGPAPSGVSAEISFTNSLIGSSEIVGSDPLLTGAGGRLWITKDHFRLELQSGNGDAQIVASDGSFWAYDPASNTVYEGQTATTGGNGSAGTPGWYSYSPSEARSAGPATAAAAATIPTLASIQNVIDRLSSHLDGLTAQPTDVAGQAAYSVDLSPKDNGSLLASVQLAWDASRPVPLSFSVYAKGDSSPVIALQATSISYGAVPDSVFDISPPGDAKVVHLSSPAAVGANHAPSVPYPIAPSPAPDRPAQAGGLSLSSSQQVGRRAWLLSYGTGGGAVEVIERDSSGSRESSPSGGQGSADQGDGTLSLPTETIDGATATYLSTELGTVIEFTHAGVSYLVLGSVPLGTANAVARAL